VTSVTDTGIREVIVIGSGYRKLGLPNQNELSDRGVSWCAACDEFAPR
jgi:thioredoxin reductase (NADPH)